TFAYDATNKLTSRTLPNGVVTTSQYDALDRLTRLTHAKVGNTLADFQYQFNAVNSITQMIDGAGAHNYSYDTRDRLTAGTKLMKVTPSTTWATVLLRIRAQVTATRPSIVWLPPTGQTSATTPMAISLPRWMPPGLGVTPGTTRIV
ncbi:MAG: RHS repeat domain-containing protein, partial [Pyrinomonadaceae bacterium]